MDHGLPLAGARATVLVSAVLIGIVYLLAQGNQGLLYILSNALPPLLALVVFAIAVAGLFRNGVSLTNRISMVWLVSRSERYFGYWGNPCGLCMRCGILSLFLSLLLLMRFG